MQIIVWRHAEAAATSPDLKRVLTKKGRHQAVEMAEKLRKMLPENYQLWVSQAIRSQQTGAFLSNSMKIISEMNPNQDVHQLVTLLAKQADSSTVVLVGHQPWLGELCSFLLNQNWCSNSHWSVKKAAFWWFESHYSAGVFSSKLRLMLSPDEREYFGLEN